MNMLDLAALARRPSFTVQCLARGRFSPTDFLSESVHVLAAFGSTLHRGQDLSAAA